MRQSVDILGFIL